MERRRLLSRSRRLLPILMSMLLLGSPVAAASPAPLGVIGQITDQVHALDDCRQDVIAAQRSLRERDAGVDLVVVFVDSTDGQAMSDYVDSIIGSKPSWAWARAALLVVATEDREYQIHTDRFLDAFISAEELDTVAADHVLPSLRKDDWCGAVLGAARGLTAATDDAGPGPEPPGTGWLTRLLASLFDYLLNP